MNKASIRLRDTTVGHTYEEALADLVESPRNLKLAVNVLGVGELREGNVVEYGDLVKLSEPTESGGFTSHDLSSSTGPVTLH